MQVRRPTVVLGNGQVSGQDHRIVAALGGRADRLALGSYRSHTSSQESLPEVAKTLGILEE